MRASAVLALLLSATFAWMLLPGAASAGAASAGATSAAARPASPSATSGRSVVIVFAPVEERQLAAVPGMSVGIVSASQGSYDAAQLLLDITQGARVANSSYPTAHPPAMALTMQGSRGTIAGWSAARARAEGAPQLLRPGLLAAQVPGGGAYAGSSGGEHLDAIAAANRSGLVAAVSLGPPASLLARIEALRAQHPLVVADLPVGALGRADLRALATRRGAHELLLVVQRARSPRGHELLWGGAAGLAEGDGSASGGAGSRGAGSGGAEELTSQTTAQRGLIAAIDLAPSALRALALEPIPADMRGAQIETDGSLSGASLRALIARLHVIAARRLRAFAWLLIAWLLLLALAAVAPGGALARARARAAAMRVGALAVLWAPVAVLISAAIEPSAGAEYAIIALSCVALAALTDRLIPWPRAPIAPAVVAVVALTADALAKTQLVVRSLLGPDPALGARFYGFGNELKSALAVLVLGAVAAALYPAVRGRRAALAMAAAGALLAVIEGAARIGAGVGGVILVSAGTAVAAVMLLPGALTRRRALLILIAPALALVALALIDLATAHGGGHYTGSILHARSPTDLRDVIVRRYKAAWDELRNHAMPVATAIALGASVYGVRRRRQLLAPVGRDPGFEAALAGGLSAGVVGALAEDSGPVLLVVAVFALGCLLSYLWGRPPLTTRSPGTSRAERSRAPIPAAARAR